MSDENGPGSGRGLGAPLGNLNRMKQLGISMEGYDLLKVSDCFRLLQEIAFGVLNGTIGSRAAGSANNAVRIILSNHPDILQVQENKRSLAEAKRKIMELEQKLARANASPAAGQGTGP